MKYKSMLYMETFTLVEVEAESQEKADEKVLMGKYEDDEILDVTVKESEIIN